MSTFADMIIADDELAAYLKDKLLVRPNYGSDEPAEEDGQDVLSRWKAAQEAEKKNRDKNNESAKRGARR